MGPRSRQNKPDELSNSPWLRCGVVLAKTVESADGLCQVRKSEVELDDWIFVKTANSLYRIRVIGDGWYEASGGWFEKKGCSPTTVRVSGCSWGGSIINTGLIAACGLYVEFSNRLVTTPVQRIVVMRSWIMN